MYRNSDACTPSTPSRSSCAATAAVGTLLGLLSQAALCLAYSWSARRATWWTSAGVGASAFVAATVLLERAAFSLAIAFALVCGLLILTAGVIPVATTLLRPARAPRWDLPLRMLTATAIVVGLTTIAPRLGPTWTGLLSPFPVFALVLGAFTHRTHGAGAAADLLRGVVLGSLAHATMFMLVAALLIPYGLVWTYSWACLSAVAVNGFALSIARRPGWNGSEESLSPNGT